MANPHIVEFLSFEGCPLAPRALDVLEKAVGQLRSELQITIQQIDLLDSDTPDYLKHWGSPTILLHGRDITGANQCDATNCRIYSGPGGVPAQQDILSALSEALKK